MERLFMSRSRIYYLALLCILSLRFSYPQSYVLQNEQTTNPPIYIAFLWHMHQPIYWPYESIVQTQLQNRYPYSVFDIHNSRKGPYTNWPNNAVQKGINAGLPNFGAQVSFSGSLIENLNNLEANGNNNFVGWKSHWNNIKNQNTSLGNPRLDMVGFGYFHPLMGLIDYNDIRKQIQMHKQIMSTNFSGSYSKGIFPPENAFSNRMIPALVDEGFNWVLVDNIHFDRAAVGYPFSTSGNIYEPNKADVLNPNPNDWIQLNGLWAPTKNSARWGRQPHWVEYVNPSTGEKKKIIAVPADRYMGNEDGRGGFGALNYEAVMSQLQSYNTDPNQPILVVLHHDGDNYGGGSDGYYNSNFQNFVNWLLTKPNQFVCTTIEDYLEMFPPDPNDIIHIEDGSWSGADNGDPEFKKWLGDPGSDGYSPDINSWGVITAAKNLVETAEQIAPNNSNTLNAWKYLLVGQSSDYWYWDGSIDGIWDAHPTRAANLAIQSASLVTGADLTPPTIFLPQREPYNPGGTEWNINQTNQLKIWTYVFDKSGVASVTLKYRIDSDGINSTSSIHNETYGGGSEVGEWISVSMNGINRPSMTNIQPLLKAKEYFTTIEDLNDKLIDYYVEAIDSLGNLAKSPIKHCWIGANSGGGIGGTSVTWSPANIQSTDSITITVSNASQGAKLHWGVNGSGSSWNTPNQVYWTSGTVLFNNGPAVESPFVGPDSSGDLKITIGPFNNPAQIVNKISFVIHYNDNSWNNNNGQDFHITIGSGTQSFVMDGQLDATAQKVSAYLNTALYLGWNGSDLYLASEAAPTQGKDVFIFLTDSLKPLINAPWAKSGKVVGWKTYLANESTNNYVGWFDNSSSVNKAAGSFVEGTINIQAEFGYIPSKLYLAVGQYNTNDNGSLQHQVPMGNNNGDIEAAEFFEFDYVLSNAKKEAEVQLSFALYQNYPNPFNPVTTINYSIPTGEYVSVKIYNTLGEEIVTLFSGYVEAGKHSVSFDASKLSSGMYIYKLSAGSHTQVKKMILAK
ncbi:MAG: T9SS type A sorting domain-containing protein [Ignavibacteriaceae bacterium]|nr:T9SS type A sorting domain-containing protein [Ignavibacteriaceae bacterium]